MSECGEVPDGWSRTPLRNVLHRRTDRGRKGDLLLSVTQNRGVILQEEVGRRDVSNNDKGTYWRVEPGDIVYNTMRMWQGVSGRSELRGIVSPAYTVCMPVAPVDTRFLAYLFKIPESVTRFYRISQGLVSDTWNLRFSSFAALEFNLPPLSEQQRIVEILDALNTAISASEALIAKTQLLVHSLAEMLVSNNNSAAQEVSLGSLLTRSPRNGFSPKEVEEPTGLYALGLGCLTLDGFELRQLKNVPTGNGPERAALLHDGDLLVSRANTRDLVGLVGIYRDFGSPCIYPDLMMRLVPVTDCRPEYLELAIRSGGVRRQIQAIAQGTSASMVKIGGASIRRIKVAIPPLAEQDRVLEVVAAARGELHVRKSEREKLTQLRVGLMDDLLTGRVRVGEVADIVDRVTC